MKKLLLLSPALLLGITCAAAARQAAPAVAVKEVAATQAAPAQPTPAGAQPAGAQPAATQAAKESPRLQRLKQLTFDRRPSSILKAWAGPPGPEKAGSGPAAPTDPLGLELAAFQRSVTLGDWAAVK